ncbi:MAG: cbb3-type cytochrome c oxidase subunit 3 [Deltaproteobacteria bacterium]|nr:cbb3-type cytochrome c oxidase subunit 3 [Deltaproteobacteria bacterium]
MPGPELAYLVFGLVLCALLAGAIAYYFSAKRKAKVEEAKYKMLQDDDEP